MDYYTDGSPPGSPDVCADEYNDEKVMERIGSLHLAVASCHLDQVIHGLEDLMRFATFYYDDGKSRDSLYYEKLLIPDLMQRLRDLFFEPLVNKLVACVMDTLIPENLRRVVDEKFAMQLSDLIKNRQDVDPMLCSAALLVRKFIAYGDDCLKENLCHSGLVTHMASLVFVLMCRGSVFNCNEKEFVVHTVWAAGELLPAAHQSTADKGLPLYQMLELVLQSQDESVVTEVVAVIDLMSFAPGVPPLLRHNGLVASLLLLMLRPEYQSQAQENYFVRTFYKCLQIIHTIIQSEDGSRDVVLQEIRQTWTTDTFFSFLIKDYRNRASCETEQAVLILRFAPVPELLQMQIIPSVVSFLSDTIESESSWCQHPRQPVVSAMRFLLSLMESDGPAAVQLMDSDVLKLINNAARHFRQNKDAISLTLQLLVRMLSYPDHDVRKEQVARVLACRPLLQQIEEMLFGNMCSDLCKKVMDLCSELSPEYSGDIMQMMTTMRLG